MCTSLSILSLPFFFQLLLVRLKLLRGNNNASFWKRPEMRRQGCYMLFRFVPTSCALIGVFVDGLSKALGRYDSLVPEEISISLPGSVLASGQRTLVQPSFAIAARARRISQNTKIPMVPA